LVFDEKDEHGREVGQKSTKVIKVNHQPGYNPNQMKVTYQRKWKKGPT